MNEPPARPKSTGIAALISWCVLVAAVAATLDQLAVTTGLPDAVRIAALVALVGVGPVLLGTVAGFLIRTDRSYLELLGLACLGAACTATAVDLMWQSDPGACSGSQGCDLSLGFGAMLVFAACYAPFLVGSAVGRYAKRRRRPREA
jgi:hypothetical protein